jgi:hypothetical protein
MPQWGQSVRCPACCRSNSKCPLQLLQLHVTTSGCVVSIKYLTALLRSLHAISNAKYRCAVFTGCAFLKHRSALKSALQSPRQRRTVAAWEQTGTNSCQSRAAMPTPEYIAKLVEGGWILVEDINSRCARCHERISGRAALSPRRQRVFHLECALKASGLRNLIGTMLETTPPAQRPVLAATKMPGIADYQVAGVVHSRTRGHRVRAWRAVAHLLLGTMLCIFLYAGFVRWLYSVFSDVGVPRSEDSPKVWTDDFARIARAIPQTAEPRRVDSPKALDDEFARHAKALTNLSR